MKWLKNNIGWFGPAVFLVVALLGWSSGVFGFFVAIEAKPIAKEAAEEQIKTHELRMEPRWQAIEMRQETLEEQSTESLEILRKLDPDNE